MEVWFDAIRAGWVVTVWFTSEQVPGEDDRFATLADTHISRAVALARARQLAEKIRACDFEAIVLPIRPRAFEDSPEDIAEAIASRVNSLGTHEKELVSALLNVVDTTHRLGLVMAVEARC